ncbi:histidine phosphatase family protein [Nonomuraea sp. NPDC046570]|uniref:histidine phosphatase family protein n=1 Tax=Nonomuraea sp. NPDC046570 TaxID=3155255 RepID=UPI0033F733B7
MLFVRHATTLAMREPRFPSGLPAGCAPASEDADSSSLARVIRLAVEPGTRAFVSPAPAAAQTAAALGLVPVVVTALAEADLGRWGGLPYRTVAAEEPEGLARWLADPDAAPHGGETLAELTARVARWLDSTHPHTPAHTGAAPNGEGAATPGVDGAAGGGRVVVVCDAGVIRAALGHVLGIEPGRAGLIDLAPLSTTELTAAREGWRVAHVNRKVP